MQLLQDVEFTDVYYNLDARSLLLQVYYELDEYDAFVSLVNSYSIFLVRNKAVSEVQFSGKMNLVKLVKVLFRLKQKMPLMKKAAFQKEFAALQEKIANTKPLANKKWLMEMVEQLNSSQSS